MTEQNVDAFVVRRASLVIIKGGGEMASGVAHRLHRAGFQIVITELAQPLVVRRTVAFATAILQSTIDIEGVLARRVKNSDAALRSAEHGEIAVLVDPCAYIVRELKPASVVDAIMAKQNTGTRMDDAPIVVALGPGFTAGVDCHAVVETNRGHHLGRVYHAGSAEADTNEPAPVRGITHARVLRAPRDGAFESAFDIGQLIAANTVVGNVDGAPVTAAIAGVIRGLVANGTFVRAEMKIGDVDPSGDVSRCYSISDKARAIGGGVLEAILHLGLQVSSDE